MARVEQQKYAMTPINDLSPHPQNPRQGDVGAISKLIESNGFYGAVVAQKSTGRVLVGNHRLLAAKAVGLTKLPVLWLDVDDDRALRIMLSDNAASDLADYDKYLLSELLGALASSEGGLAGAGYDGDALDELLSDLSRGFEPTLDPDVQTRRVLDGDVKAANSAAESQYEQTDAARRERIIGVTCPNCGHDFDVS